MPEVASCLYTFGGNFWQNKWPFGDLRRMEVYQRNGTLAYSDGS